MFNEKPFGLGKGLGALLSSMMPSAKITIEQATEKEPMEMLVHDYVLVARTQTGEIVIGSGDPTFLNSAAIRVMSQALKAETAMLERASSGKDCSKCSVRSECPTQQPSK